MTELNLENIKKCVFKINTADGSGSGFYLKDYNLIVTNFHVIAGHRELAVEPVEHQKLSAKVVMINPSKDLAFLKVNEKFADLPSLKLASINDVADNAKVRIIGHPFGLPITVTEGVISAKKQNIDGSEYIQTDAAVNPGNSGGPMFNEAGQVIGVTTCTFRSADNVGFALPADALQEGLNDYRRMGEAEHIVACPECEFHMTEKMEYCNNCGTELDVNLLFAEFKPSPLGRFVETTLQEIGINPVNARVGHDYWEYHHGSARIRVFCFNGDTLIMSSPMVKLPKTDVQKLFEFMLSEQNRPYKLGFSNGEVHLSYRVHLSDLHGTHLESIRKNFIGLSAKADSLDNYLIDTFGCQWGDESKKDAA